MAIIPDVFPDTPNDVEGADTTFVKVAKLESAAGGPVGPIGPCHAELNA